MYVDDMGPILDALFALVIFIVRFMTYYCVTYYMHIAKFMALNK